MSTGRTCFEHLALDVSGELRRLNDFEHSQTAKLLEENGKLRAELDMAWKQVHHDIAVMQEQTAEIARLKATCAGTLPATQEGAG